MTSQPATQHVRRLLVRASRVAQCKLRRIVDESRNRPAGARPGGDVDAVPTTAAAQPRLAPTTALRENGFTVFRGLFPPGECARLARALKSEAGIRESVKCTKVDATNSFSTAREILLEGRVLDAVRSALGEWPRFLQVSDLHYLHDTVSWHRDSVHRAHDSSDAPDWRDTDRPFGVVKAILYLESDNAAMGIMAGSHLSPIVMDHARVTSVENAGGQLVIDVNRDPNRRLSKSEKQTPLAWKAEVGDVLVFDERMYHAGRRVDDGHPSANKEAPKFTLSLVFGLDNEHSAHMYSYFHFVRKELSYRELAAGFHDELAGRGLVLGRGWTDFYEEHPSDLRHVYLPDAARLQPLLEAYSTSRS